MLIVVTRRMEQAGIVARVGEKRITYKISVEKSEEIY